MHHLYLLPLLQWAQQNNCLDLQLPDQLPHISPGSLQWGLGSYKGPTPGVTLQAMTQSMIQLHITWHGRLKSSVSKRVQTNIQTVTVDHTQLWCWKDKCRLDGRQRLPGWTMRAQLWASYTCFISSQYIIPICVPCCNYTCIQQHATTQHTHTMHTCTHTQRRKSHGYTAAVMSCTYVHPLGTYIYKSCINVIHLFLSCLCGEVEVTVGICMTCTELV